ncbi:MAG TPA: arsenate reductase family protein [Methylocella sp.]|nr:arsenate reductase family protein [Methylocella sp.]
MAEVIFYEKPGCGTNALQKRMLDRAGHKVIARNLLAEAWTAERLLGFFGAAPVTAWINSAAPGVKSGQVDPASITPSDALALMISDPIYIRGPLIEALGARCAGFEGSLVASLLGDCEPDRDVQGCRLPETYSHCPSPAQSERLADP